MFRLYQHHDPGVLASLLAALREHSAPTSPLAPETIVVPNRGTARWLQAELAATTGSAANLELPVPGRFVWQVLRDTLPGTPDSSGFERERLVWHLYALLPAIGIPAVQRYLAGTPAERQRYQLAQQLAEVFDAYLVHRRDVLQAWEAGREETIAPAVWQAPIWRALVERLGPRHRAALLSEFLQRAASGRLDVARLPATIHVFAPIDLPPDYLRLLYALGDYLDVHCLLPNPSAVYWGDLRRQRANPGTHSPTDGRDAVSEPGFRSTPSGLPADDTDVDGHPLLASLGRTGRDFLRVLYSDEFAELVEPDLGDALAAEPPAADSLLHRVQADVIRGDTPTGHAGFDATDGSIQVHACAGPLREMQVLHDRLLDLLVQHPELEPRRILVLLPDVGRYAPAIRGVFGTATGGRWIPWRIADRPRLDSHPIAQTFHQLLELPLSRWTASEVLALAQVPAVARRFELDDGDLDHLRQWIPAAGVRWGLDAADRAAGGGAGFAQNTWQFGLDRLLLGIAQSDEECLVAGVAPWSDLEGGAAAAVGQLWSLLTRLRHWRDRLAESATAGAWQERLNALTNDLFAPAADDDEAAALATVHETVATLATATAALADEGLSWEAMREALLGALQGGSPRQPLLTGGVTFAGLEPLRGVPFDVIAMVGLDDGVFPRQDHQSTFDLLQQQPRSGDPGVRDLQRMTFLQSLMAARRCFYLSYTGRDVANGETLQPSPVVGEFLDFLHAGYFDDCSEPGDLVTEQPLHPFSPDYFRPGDEHLFTFVGDWQRAARAQRGERHVLPALIDDTRLPTPPIEEPIALADLQRFCRHPARWFFRQCLQLELGEQDETIDDDEPRELDKLAAYQLRQRLFDTARAAGAESLAAAPSALERARGHLPPPPLDEPVHTEAVQAVEPLLALDRSWQAEDGATRALDIDLTLDDGTRLMGRVESVGTTELRRLRPGSLRLTHLIPWWLDYLALVASGHVLALRVAGVGNGAADERIARVGRDEARDCLQALVELWRDGHTRPLPFEPDLAGHYLDELEKIDKSSGTLKTPDQALQQMNNWFANQWQPPHAANDPWLVPLFEPAPTPLGESAEASAFVRAVEIIAAPIHARLHPVEANA